MKLVQKLTAALVVSNLAVLSINGYFRIDREIGVLRANREADHRLLSRSLSAGASAAWRAGGQNEALDVINGANNLHGPIHARFIEAPPNNFSDIATLAPGDAKTQLADRTRITFTPLTVEGRRVGYLELSESLDAERAATTRIVIDTITATGALAVVTLLLSGILGFWLVGKPVQALSEKARRIGAGDFSQPLDLRHHDELGVLAAEMNATCDRLVEAHQRIERETSARIATMEQLRHADRLMTVGKLASGLAHELGTPLNVVLARAEMIADAAAPSSETHEYARAIMKASSRMAEIIQNLMAFARRKPTHKVAHDLKRLTEETLALLKPLAQKSGARLELHCPDERLDVEVNGGEIQQAITNLVVNAIQAARKGGEVSVLLERKTETPPNGGAEMPCVCVHVRDEGEGISPENVVHVFEPFFTTKEVGRGTGLGLSVTHGIVEDHGGWIRVESEVGKGTEFSIYLPLTSARTTGTS